MLKRIALIMLLTAAPLWAQDQNQETPDLSEMDAETLRVLCGQLYQRVAQLETYIAEMEELESPADTAAASLAPATDAQQAFQQLPASIQARFRKHAPNYTRIGPKIWSVELMRRYELMKEKHHEDYQLEPYAGQNVPFFYDPVAARGVTNVRQIIAEIPGVTTVSGQVLQVLDEGILVSSSGRVSFIEGVGGVVDDDGISERVTEIGTYQYITTMGTQSIVARYRLAEIPIEPVTPEELYVYFRDNGVTSFPVLTPRKVVDEPGRVIYSTRRSGNMIRKTVSDRIPEKYHYEWDTNLIPALPRPAPSAER